VSAAAQIVEGSGLIAVASAAWRLYYLRLCRRVYEGTGDPTVLEQAKAVFERPPLLLGNDTKTEINHEPLPASRPSPAASRFRSWLLAHRRR
jgi:hypothetical protein